MADYLIYALGFLLRVGLIHQLVKQEDRGPVRNQQGESESESVDQCSATFPSSLGMMTFS